MIRRLNEEERRLWAGVVRSVRPLRPAQAAAMASLSSEAAGPPAAEPRPTAGSRSAGPRTAGPDTPPSPPSLAPLGRRDTKRLTRGHTEIDARLDLHGMTQAEAHAALRRFVAAAQARGARFVLVITGKGGDGDAGPGREHSRGGHLHHQGRGILRRQVPLWLQLPEFRAYVVGFDAAAGHGGAGALYVRIRRPR